MQPRKIAVIYNPVAGGARRFNRAPRLIRHLKQAGHSVLVYSTEKAGHATELAREAIGQGAEIVVAVGGDGTVNEVVQGMAGSAAALAVFPAGTTNVWCRQVQMPYSPRRAARIIGQGDQRLIDLGRANNHYFLLMTGIGFDGEVTQAVNLRLKKRVGKLAYALAAIPVGLRFRGSPVRLIINPDSSQPRQLDLRTSLIIVTNTERYATVKLAREARLDDGQLDLLVFDEKNMLARLRQVYSVLTNHSDRNPTIQRYRVKRAVIEPSLPVGVQIDGDPCGRSDTRHPLEIECVPAALKVVLPPGVDHTLFDHYSSDAA